MNNKERLEQIRQARIEEQSNVSYPPQYPEPTYKTIKFGDLSFMLRIGIVGGVIYLVYLLFAFIGVFLLSMMWSY